MKLEDYLENVFGNKSSFFGVDVLNKELLEAAKESLLQCDEFKDVSELVVLNFPAVNNSEGKLIQSFTYKLHENTKFKGKAYIQSISLSPEIFDPKDLDVLVKNDCSITPNLYDKDVLCLSEGLSWQKLYNVSKKFRWRRAFDPQKDQRSRIKHKSSKLFIIK